jgi:hypothetical protein
VHWLLLVMFGRFVVVPAKLCRAPVGLLPGAKSPQSLRALTMLFAPLTIADCAAAAVMLPGLPEGLMNHWWTSVSR